MGKQMRITGDGATDHICYSANIAFGDFFNSVAGFFRFDSTMIISLLLGFS